MTAASQLSDAAPVASASAGAILTARGLEKTYRMGEVVVHVMQPQIREFYDLENLWQVDLSQQRESI